MKVNLKEKLPPQMRDFLYEPVPVITRYLLIGIAFVVVVTMGAMQIIAAPSEFPADHIFVVEEGQTIQQIAEQLEQTNIISSPVLFRGYLRMLGAEGIIVSGDYLFEQKLSVFAIAERMRHGQYGDSRIRITIPEGVANSAIARILDEHIPNFDTEEFFELAEGKEGYLYPDTYYFFASATPKKIIRAMEENFEEKFVPLQEDLELSGRTLEEIVIMASIIEREANSGVVEENRMISGILWNRIAMDMPLQVDAVFAYLLGKGSSQLTYADLATDSPYNTYKNKGLPIGPIGNPGFVALEAALHPKENPYVFYLHDKTGGIHYAETYTAHKRNKRTYLD